MIESMRALLTAVLIAQFSHTSLAAETDAFTTRYQHIPNALPMINQEFNLRIEHALAELNRENARCLPSELDTALSLKLRRPFRGLIEDFIDISERVPHQRVPLKASVYQNLPIFFNLALTVGAWMGIGLTSHIQHDGLLIGADKFGHFLDEGYYYYYFVHRQGLSLESALQFGEFLESTLEGSGSSGIYSYADLAANYSGYRFWQDTLGTSLESLQSKYISCSGDTLGQWSIKSPVDLLHYVGAAWDEGMNCNEFQYSSITDGVEKSIAALEQEAEKNNDPRRYRCPIFPEKIPRMLSENADVLAHVIHPKVINTGK